MAGFLMGVPQIIEPSQRLAGAISYDGSEADISLRKSPVAG